MWWSTSGKRCEVDGFVGLSSSSTPNCERSPCRISPGRECVPATAEPPSSVLYFTSFHRSASGSWSEVLLSGFLGADGSDVPANQTKGEDRCNECALRC